MQLLRIGFFIFGLILANQAHGHDELLDQLELINSKSKMNSINCTPEESPFIRDASSKKFCSAIKKVVEDEDAHVCTPYYRNGKPHWENPEIRREIETYATSDAVAESRSDFSKQGFTVATLPQKIALLSKLNSFRTEMIPSCCRGDADCEKAFNAVTLELCSDSEADIDPNSADSCTLTNGYHQATSTTAKRYQVLAMIYGAAKSDSDREYIQSLTMISPDEVAAKLVELGISRPTSPVSGQVVVSPYFRNGSAKVSDRTLRHELAHACSSVKRQLSAIRGDRASALSLAIQQRRNDSCELHPKAVDAYSKLLDDVRESRSVAQCLYDAADESTDSDSYAYVKDSCPGSKLEEGFAIARSLIEAPLPLVPNTFPKLECTSRPSRKHPASAEVADCLVRHSSAFRNQLKREFQCR